MKKQVLLFKLLGTLLLLNISVSKFSAQCAANFAYTLNPNGNVDFVSTSTGTSAATIYQWWFGDSNSSNVDPANHTYANNGTYTVELFIYDPGPPTCSTSISQTIQITSAPVPTCNLNASFTYTITGPGQVSFESTSTGTTATSTYTWNYGDANIGTGANSVHTYTTNGFYPVALWVQDGPTCFDTVYQNVFINNLPCNLTASFTYTNLPNGQVDFTSTSTGTNNLSTGFAWHINNVQANTGATFSNFFANGTYSISLVVNTYSPACTDTTMQVITVSNNTCNLNASFTYTQAANGVVNFQSTSTGTIPSMVYTWNFGDSNGIIGSNTTPTHTYTNGGNHQVLLIVTDPNNAFCKDTMMSTINITSVPCTANSNFTLQPVSPGFWYAIPDYPWNVVAASWDWGDNTSSNTLYASHTYSPAGMYTICLSVTVSCAATSTTCSAYLITKSVEIENLSMAHIDVVPPTVNITNINTLHGAAFSELSVFPNPTSGEMNISIKNLTENLQHVSIYNITGSEVYQAPGASAGNSMEYNLNLNHLNNGIYFINFKFNNSVVNKKIVISK